VIRPDPTAEARCFVTVDDHVPKREGVSVHASAMPVRAGGVAREIVDDTRGFDDHRIRTELRSLDSYGANSAALEGVITRYDGVFDS
jgi:hypothetical protein